MKNSDVEEVRLEKFWKKMMKNSKCQEKICRAKQGPKNLEKNLIFSARGAKKVVLNQGGGGGGHGPFAPPPPGILYCVLL